MEQAQERLEADWRSLIDQERSRADRFRQQADRLRFVACRAALRQLLAACLETTAAEVPLAETQFGKLRLADETAAREWKFNVAHSGQQGCVALGRQRELGIDVESPRQPVNLDLLCSKVLSENEMRQYRQVAPEDRLRTFLRYWTLKEAVAKATGLGLRLPLATIEIDLQLPQRLVSVPPQIGVASGFFASELDPPQPGYLAALAVCSERTPRVRCGHWPPDATLVGTPGR